MRSIKVHLLVKETVTEFSSFLNMSLKKPLIKEELKMSYTAVVSKIQ
jgi:hypothetical protein